MDCGIRGSNPAEDLRLAELGLRLNPDLLTTAIRRHDLAAVATSIDAGRAPSSGDYSSVFSSFAFPEKRELLVLMTVSYTHLTLPTICSV